MARKRQGSQIWMILIVAVVVLGVWFFFFRGGGCVTDTDCGTGKVCNLEGKCQAADTNGWDGWGGTKPDLRCPDNTGASGVGDPDCPNFCPIGTPASRAGIAGMCCYDLSSTHAIDCESGDALFDTKVNAFDELINILPSYPVILDTQAVVTFWGQNDPQGTGSSKTQVANTVSWNAPSPYPGGVTSLDVWLKEVSIDGTGVVTSFTDAWKAGKKDATTLIWGTPTVSQVGNKKTITGTTFNKFTGASAGNWFTPTFNLDTNMAIGNYVVTYTYCYQDTPKTVFPTEICKSMVYNLAVESSTVSFTVSAAMT